jgi:hypothetical protein
MESVTWLGEAFDMVEPVLPQIAENGNMDMLNYYDEWKRAWIATEVQSCVVYSIILNINIFWCGFDSCSL